MAQEISRLGQHSPVVANALLPSTPVANLPFAIKSGLRDLMVAFPAGAQQDIADKGRLAQIYWEACAGNPSFVIEEALRHLKFHNPRNPFPPTPQDLFELCAKKTSNFEASLFLYYLQGYDWDGRSNPCGRNAMNQSGPEPGHVNCIIPPDFVTAYLEGQIASDPDVVQSRLVDLPDDKFARFPRELLTDQSYASLLALRERRVLAEREYEEYLDEVRHRRLDKYGEV